MLVFKMSKFYSKESLIMKKLFLALTLVLCLAVSMVVFTSCGGDCEHTWAAEATVDTAATCTQEGVASIKCTSCGEKKEGSETVVPVTAHAYDEGTTVAGTCTQDGSVTKTCTVCGYVNTETIPATGSHIWQANASVDSLPTCTTDGQKSIKCIICQTIKEDSVIVLPASHEWEAAPSVDTPATETTQGQKSIKCLTCGATKPGSVVVLPAYNETYSYPMDTVEPLEGSIVAFKNNDCYDSKFVLSSTKFYALIDISSIAFNYVTITKAEGALGFDYAFLTEELAEGDRPYYAEGFFGVIERRYDDSVTVHIPEDATYIYIVVTADEASYLPASMVFSYKEFVEPADGITDGTKDSYEYPMESIEMGEGSIYNTENTYRVKDSVNGYFRVAFIDLTDVAFNTIRMGTSFTVRNVLYTFLTEIPEIGDTISYATGYSGPKMSYPFEEDYVRSNYEFTVTIPADAKVLVIYYVDFWYYNNFPDYWGPSYIVFENGEGDSEPSDPTPDQPSDPTPDSTPLENLQDETLDSYEYPMDKVVGTDGAIIYWASGEDKNKYLTEFDEHDVGFYKNAFIEITDTVFNYVTLVGNGNKVAGWAFITDMPEVGEKATYVGNFATMNKFAWTVDKDGTAKIEIPEGAKYLVIYYEEAGNSYLPASITFTKEEKPATEGSYSYPMDEVVPAEGFINHSGKATDEKGHYFNVTTNNEACAFIDLTGLDYDTVTLYAPLNGEATNFTFLTKIPTTDKEKLSYATGYSDCYWYGLGNGALTVAIPEDAVCLVVLYNYSNQTVTCPEAIVFSNSDTATDSDETVTPLDKLQDATLDHYEYPMDEVVGTDGAIIYWASGDDKNKYLTEFEEHSVGFYKNAFIEITDTVFNYVYIVSNGNKKAGWAFVTEIPEVGEKASYAGNFTITKKFSWVVDKADTAKVEIPEGAKYLVIYYEEAGNSYLPLSITFTKEEAVDTENVYEYPMDTIVPTDGYINHNDSATTNNGKYHYLRLMENNERYAFIDISGLDYNTVTLTGPANGEATNYAFLTKIPTVDDEKISYATGYSDCIWYSLGNGTITVNIPADATCLAILYNYSNQTETCPESIVFSNRESHPSEMLKNDTLTSYEYPMTEITASMGTIASVDNKFIRNYRWVTALVPIEGCVFDKVVFEIDEKYGKISYGFLTEYPTVNEVVSFAGDTTGMTTANIADGATVTVDIPADAKVLVVYWHDWDEANGSRIYYIPESITFIKADDTEDVVTPNPGDSEDAEDAETTTPGGATDSEDAENAGGGSTDSEDAETTTPANPGFGSASDAEDAA